MNMQSEPVMTTVAELMETRILFEEKPLCVLWKMGTMRKIESWEVQGFNIVMQLNILISQEQPFNVTAF